MEMTTTKKRGLGGGRGLNALLSGVKQVQDTVAAVEEGKVPVDGELKKLPVEFMQRGRYQPRRDMDPAALQELADSIKLQGVMHEMHALRETVLAWIPSESILFNA